MEIFSLNAAAVKRSFLAGAANLDNNKEYINELNVFPVPDGDTGTNMTMTIMSAVRFVEQADESSMEEICKAISTGSLRGARGNSGVILSQLLRGLCKVLGSCGEVDAMTLAEAFGKASSAAYKAVIKPKEGTILTVAKGMSEKIIELAPSCSEIVSLVRQTVDYGRLVLSKTPELLPVLKEAGVVDSGGQGLVTIMEGVLASLEGKELMPQMMKETKAAAQTQTPLRAAVGALSTDNIKFGYCTEFIINTDGELEASRAAELRSFLESIGDSVVLVVDDGMTKIHVHTNHPGQAFEKGLEIGSLSSMKVDNLREEHREVLIKQSQKQSDIAGNTGAAMTVPGVTGADASGTAASEASLTQRISAAEKQQHKETAFVAVAAGSGFADIFRALGADYVIEGGQTMNPSTDDILNAADIVNADTVFVLPNNKNIILAAEQAAAISDNCRIMVIPSKTVPQGIAALINNTGDGNADEQLAAMTESLSAVKTAEVTYAVRNTSINGHEIHEGDIMAIGDSGLLAVGHDTAQTALEALEAMTDDSDSFITVYSGEEISDEESERLIERIRERYSEMEVTLERGNQPVYYYVISVE